MCTDILPQLLHGEKNQHRKSPFNHRDDSSVTCSFDWSLCSFFLHSRITKKERGDRVLFEFCSKCGCTSAVSTYWTAPVTSLLNLSHLSIPAFCEYLFFKIVQEHSHNFWSVLVNTGKLYSPPPIFCIYFLFLLKNEIKIKYSPSSLTPSPQLWQVWTEKFQKSLSLSLMPVGGLVVAVTLLLTAHFQLSPPYASE